MDVVSALVDSNNPTHFINILVITNLLTNFLYSFWSPKAHACFPGSERKSST